ncbi:hypothetical protein QBC37DRAFT_136368 [Rhypophila decipiens]|uniref:Uncharacterized protein n=1 Tax=Rhypophila decipiens TaxID=261697 RepID=A0AAN6YJZ8_9PEZI|nr:hypothetical protein QBC37DRAFT_136368 [Rhypophila decipiens]
METGDTSHHPRQPQSPRWESTDPLLSQKWETFVQLETSASEQTARYLVIPSGQLSARLHIRLYRRPPSSDISTVASAVTRQIQHDIRDFVVTTPADPQCPDIPRRYLDDTEDGDTDWLETILGQQADASIAENPHSVSQSRISAPKVNRRNGFQKKVWEASRLSNYEGSKRVLVKAREVLSARPWPTDSPQEQVRGPITAGGERLRTCPPSCWRIRG